MSGVLKVVSKIAGLVAGIASKIPGGQLIAAIAGAVAVVAGIGAQLLYKPPPAKGSVNGIVIGAENARPYVVGRSYGGGALIHDVGYGPTTNKVPNPYRAMVMVYSGGGPIDGFESFQSDFASVGYSGTAATGYFAGFMWRSFQLGLLGSSALTGNFGAIPQWSSAHKLSGLAAVLYSLKFDRDGKVFASGVPQLGAVMRGVLCYDPRKDSTYPGGSGTHRWADPSNTSAHDAARATWQYTRDPGLHALNYALGRWERDTSSGSSVYKKTMGIGLPIEGIKVSDFVALANVCDANSWYCDGIVFEPGDRWANIKDMLAAGGAQPVFDGGLLGVMLSAPRVALDTITAQDLADDEVSVGAMQSWRARLNAVIPKYRSENHKWEYVSADRVAVPSYRTEDGEDKVETIQYNLVTGVNQAAQLAAYALTDGRELGEITLTAKSRLRLYPPGSLMTLNLPEAGLASVPCVILKRTVDPATMNVQLVLRGETAAKHAYALGNTGTPPPTPTLVTTATLDSTSDDVSTVQVQDAQLTVAVTPLAEIGCDNSGAPTTDELPRRVSVRVSQGANSVKLSDDTQYSATFTNLTATIDTTNGSATKGDFVVTAMSANEGYADVIVTVGGAAQTVVRTVFKKVLAAASAPGGVGSKVASDSTLNAISTTAFVRVSDTMTLTLATGERFYGTGSLDYYCSGTTTALRDATVKWGYRLVGGGAFTDFAAGIIGTSAESGQYVSGVWVEAVPGHVDAIQNVAGLAAGNYELALFAAASTTGRTLSWDGTARIEAKV